MLCTNSVLASMLGCGKVLSLFHNTRAKSALPSPAVECNLSKA